MDEEILEQQETPKSNKEVVLSRLQAMFPDVDEETMYGKFMEFMDDMDRASKAHAELGQKLTAHPKAALMLGEMLDGRHPAVAMKRYFSDDELTIGEDEEGYEELINAERERIAEHEERESLKAEYAQNLSESEESVKAFQEEKGLSEEEFSAFMESAIEITADLLSGKLNPTLLETLWKGRNYDTDIANETSLAEERGKLSERNTKIEEKKKRMEGDGLPVVTSSTSKSKEFVIPTRKSAWEK